MGQTGITLAAKRLGGDIRILSRIHLRARGQPRMLPRLGKHHPNDGARPLMHCCPPRSKSAPLRRANIIKGFPASRLSRHLQNLIASRGQFEFSVFHATDFGDGSDPSPKLTSSPKQNTALKSHPVICCPGKSQTHARSLQRNVRGDQHSYSLKTSCTPCHNVKDLKAVADLKVAYNGPHGRSRGCCQVNTADRSIINRQHLYLVTHDGGMPDARPETSLPAPSRSDQHQMDAVTAAAILPAKLIKQKLQQAGLFALSVPAVLGRSHTCLASSARHSSALMVQRRSASPPSNGICRRMVRGVGAHDI